MMWTINIQVLRLTCLLKGYLLLLFDGSYPVAVGMCWLLFIGYLVLLHQSLRISGCTPPSFDNLTVQENFDLNKFLGVWFEIKWLPGTPHSPSDIWHHFYQSFQLENSSTKKLLVFGQAQVLNNDTCFSFGPWSIAANNSAKMVLEKQDINSQTALNWPYYVLKTDYEHYALIYGCTTGNYTYTNPCANPVLWIFGRTTSLSSANSITLDTYIVNQLCVNLTTLEITPHDGKQCYSLANMHLSYFSLLVFLLILCI